MPSTRSLPSLAHSLYNSRVLSRYGVEIKRKLFRPFFHAEPCRLGFTLKVPLQFNGSKNVRLVPPRSRFWSCNTQYNMFEEVPPLLWIIACHFWSVSFLSELFLSQIPSAG